MAGIVAGPEQPVSPVTIDAAAFDQSHGRIASDGDGFLVVFGNSGNVNGTRVSRNRKSIDAVPLVIAGTADFEFEPEIAFGRDRYFVVWLWDDGLRGRFVMPDGTMSPPIEIPAEDAATPEVAFNGEVFLVVWSVPGPRETRGAIVGLDGTVRKLVDLGQGGFHRPQVTAADGAFYVAAYQWQTQDVALTKVAGDGSIVSKDVVIADVENVSNFVLGTHGDEVVIAWNSGYPSATAPIKGVIGGEPFVFGQGWLRTIVSDADGAVLVYAIDNEYARRIGSNDTYLLPQKLPSAVLDGASNGTDVVLVTSVYRDGGDLYLQSVGRGEIELLTRAPRHQHSPEIAAAGELDLVIWSEQSALRMVVVGPEGAGTPVDIVTNAAPFIPHAVASNGSEWLVIWGENGAYAGARVTRDGELLEKFVVARDVMGFGLDVAWDGSAYVVVFLRGRIGRGSYITNVYATRVSPGGPAGPEVQVTTTSDIQYPAVAASPTAALVSWFDRGRTRTALLSAAGTVTPLIDIADAAPIPAAIAWNGSTFLLAVRRRNDLRWMTVSPAGVIVEAPDSATIHPSRPGGSIDLAPLGSRFLLLAQGHAAILDPRGFSGELVPVTPDVNARLSGLSIAYARPVEAAWQNITRVFVKRLMLQASEPRRRSVR